MDPAYFAGPAAAPDPTDPKDRFPPPQADDNRSRSQSGNVTQDLPRDPSRDQSTVSGLAEMELDSALQLLVQRAQYITGATGTALALHQGEDMICRASAGSSAPAVGVRLQVQSGLTGESISRRQLLRCDNAESDPRVNLEACRALGIASIVVLPLLRRNGEVRGLFELFSDHPYTLSKQTRSGSARAHGRSYVDGPRSWPNCVRSLSPRLHPSINRQSDQRIDSSRATPVRDTDVDRRQMDLPEPAVTSGQASTQPQAPLPVALHRVQKCASCGFPVSEGRTFCLDCEKKDNERTDTQNEGKDDQA